MSFFFLCLELLLLAILRTIGIEEIPDILSAVLILSFSLVYMASLPRKSYVQKHSDALIIGFLFRLMLLFFDLYGRNIYTLPNSSADAEMFFANATVVAHGGITVRGAFPELMGYFFRVFCISRPFGQFILMLCSMVSIECAAKIFGLIDMDEWKRGTALWLLCLLPNFAILSSIFLRESLIAMFISLSMLEYVKWIKTKSETSFILALVLTLGSMRFHSGTIAVPIGYLISRILYDNKQEEIRISAKNVIISAVSLLVGMFILSRVGDSFWGKFSTLDSLEDIANTSTIAGSSYAQYVGNSNNPISMVIFTIPRMVFFLFSPMPWMIRGVSDIIAFCFSSSFYIVTTIQVFRFLRMGEKKNRELVIVILIVCLCAAFVFGWGVSNAGTACRHREKMTIIWGILYGLTIRPKRRTYPFNSMRGA